MPGKLTRVWRIVERHGEEVLCGVLLVSIILVIWLQVALRYLFHAPLSWVDEVAIYAFICFVYLSASLAVRERAHIRVLNLIEAFPSPLRTILIALSDAAWLAFSLVMTWQGTVLVENLWTYNYRSTALGISQKWPYLAIPVGFLLMSLRLVQIYWRWARQGGDLLPPRTSDHE